MRRALCSLAVLCGCAAYHEPAVRGLPRDDLANASFSAVWIGHATVLMRFGRREVLADPNLGGAILFYPRLTPPSVTARELPPVDVVLLSHMHVDHFDLRTVRALGRRPVVVYPAGAEPYVSGLEQRRLPLSSWQTATVDGLDITAVPVAHAGGRYAIDSWWNHAYCGFIVQGAGRTVFFAGDTGYDPERFRAIGKRFPNIDVAFIPIAPARGGNGNHASPEEAVQIFREVGARLMVPIHFEAYWSSVVPYAEPREHLAAAAEKAGLADRVYALRTGERLVLPDAPGAPAWISDEVPPAAPKPQEKMPPPPKPAAPEAARPAPAD